MIVSWSCSSCLGEHMLKARPYGLGSPLDIPSIPALFCTFIFACLLFEVSMVSRTQHRIKSKFCLGADM